MQYLLDIYYTGIMYYIKNTQKKIIHPHIYATYLLDYLDSEQAQSV